MNTTTEIFDTTLRDGAQASGISFTTRDKIKIISLLDDFGVDFIEAGNPSVNPKDAELFELISGMKMKNAKICAFTSTCKPGENASQCESLIKTAALDVVYVSIVGKSSSFHVENVLRTDREENLRIIRDSISYLISHGKKVIFYAEHFFDGIKNDSDYTLRVITTAANAGCDCIVLCDTNGGTLPHDIAVTVATASRLTDCKLGIHCHNDSGMAVASTVSAMSAGATQLHGTFLGIGERCGNTALTTLIPTVFYKMNVPLTCADKIPQMYDTARKIADISNITIDNASPYIGAYAFTHKAGMHIDAVMKDAASFEHINPVLVGNSRHKVISEFSGKSTLYERFSEISPGITKDAPQIASALAKIKQYEHEGYHYENADASLDLLILEELGKRKKFFELKNFKLVLSEPDIQRGSDSKAAVLMKIAVGDAEEITAAEGNGPVDAMDAALRKALRHFYPSLSKMRLIDYKVRVLDSDATAGARVRVLIESGDTEHSWHTVGVSTDIMEASWKALIDSVEYKLSIDEKIILPR
ncbi:MAG: citramalate synthase [Ruminococcaceae bacterium]|nr:citramalate synthase [Oscillospiraceae bacterium]